MSPAYRAWHDRAACAKARQSPLRSDMNPTQSPHIPAEGQKPRITDLGWLARYSARGLTELVRARIAFATLEARDIPARNRRTKEGAHPAASVSQEALARIA